MDDNRFFYQSGLIAIGIYASFLLTLIIYFSYTNKKDKVYSFRQDTFFEISMKKFDKSKDVKKSKIHKYYVKKNHKILKKNGSLTHKRGLNLNSLFKNVKDDSFDGKLDDYKLTTSKSSKISRKYGQKNQTISQKINSIEKSLEKLKLTSFHTKYMLYNEYYSKISRLLTIEFNKQVVIKGNNKSIVIVSIDKFGNFTYIINKYSKDSFFNLKLQEFLDYMLTKTFPVYKKQNTIIKVIFKTED
jgi:hypothetical protein